MTVRTLEPATRRLAAAFDTRLKDVRKDFVGRDEAIELVALAMLCREHVLLVGPPGTAKTSLLDSFRLMLGLGEHYFSYLLTRFTEPAEVFGPVDIKQFQEDGVYKINTRGMLPEAYLAFLDEVFQGSSAILNTLLTIVNERTFRNGTETMAVPLVTLLGSSNEIPDDPELAAFNDRFMLRCRLDYVPDDDVEKVLDIGWAGEKHMIRRNGVGAGDTGGADDPAARTRVTFSLAELAALQHAVAEVDLAAVRGPFARIVRSLRGEGVVFSDRRAVKAQKVFAASAVLAGRGSADVADLARLAHLWASPRDEASIRRILADHGVEVPDAGRPRRSRAEIALVLGELKAERDRCASTAELRELLDRGQRLVVELKRDHPQASHLLTDAQHIQQDTMTAFRKSLIEQEWGGV